MIDTEMPPVRRSLVCAPSRSDTAFKAVTSMVDLMAAAIVEHGDTEAMFSEPIDLRTTGRLPRSGTHAGAGGVGARRAQTNS